MFGIRQANYVSCRILVVWDGWQLCSKLL